MNLIGKRVIHRKRYGKGMIVDLKGYYIYIKFEKEDAIKLFKYPECFPLFIELIDENVIFEERTESKTDELHMENFYLKYKNALLEEVISLRDKKGKKYHVFEGKFIEVRFEIYIYTFETEDELNIPEGTKILIEEYDEIQVIEGTLIECDGFTVTLGLKIDLGKEIPSVDFIIDHTFLLEALVRRLGQIKENPSKIVQALIGDYANIVEKTRYDMMKGQEKAIEMSTSQPITFVWGPPGTGKTETLTNIVLECIEKGYRVLMVSYSNVSVDGAIMRVYKNDKKKEYGKLIRCGYPKDKELVENPSYFQLVSYNLVIYQHKELMNEQNWLIARRSKVKRDSREYVEIGRKLSNIRKKLADEEKKAIQKAKFVATTISKTVVDDLLGESKFDVVIFDEASMAYIPQIIFAASLATKHFVCMGDFKQLPPIVQSGKASALNQDIFAYCKITEAVENGYYHKWLCMLDVQHRMHPQIAEFVSKNMYKNLLKSDEKLEPDRREIVQSNPLCGYPLGLVDLSKMKSICKRTSEESRFNALSAFIAFSLALEAAKNYEVGIITPYRAQARLIHAMTRDIALANPNLKSISSATVHQFQGAEKDVILYDSVDSEPISIGKLITEQQNDEANRLFNVAMTRARGKFIAITDCEYMENNNLSQNLMFRKMIHIQKDSKSCLNEKKINKKRLSIWEERMHFLDQEDGMQSFLTSIEQAHKEVRIDIPSGEILDSLVDDLVCSLQNVKRKGILVMIRVQSKQKLPLKLKGMSIETSLAANPIAIIDKEIVWFGMPKVVSDTKIYPTFCFIGKHTASVLYGLIGMDNIIDQSKEVEIDEEGQLVTDTFSNYIFAHKKCNECGRTLKLKKKRGKREFFIGCSGYPNCKNTSPIKNALVEEYLRKTGKEKCKICNAYLTVQPSRYREGVYIKCYGRNEHTFLVDEI